MTYSLASSDKITEKFTFSNSIWNIHLFFLYSFIKKLVGATSAPTNGIYFPLVGADGAKVKAAIVCQSTNQLGLQSIWRLNFYKLKPGPGV
ncbi:hypothetical protein NC651_039386 [Populus alba x Populus x berolinensis]|nr:hypothetical protein NC651_039386 [Populus alba x Populus x berolinensis]